MKSTLMPHEKWKISGPMYLDYELSHVFRNHNLKKWTKLGLFFAYFQSFQSNVTILQQTNEKNVYLVYGVGIRTRNLLITRLLP